ncbi:hypothetical protein DAPPUDRAFT_304032 [Daphnia pulex]|uniref:Uncharacterized protein n=1 Tax=Daphnia pulex TaxID=6669 RepID=E9GJB2_DAPPU|nr:hypothetical protein DAPPUDRAFT_304032 [Daphnia pulex]|eukprot:EFX80417.1 hypothetical protein DAPPUDRAFT_304032 [Daphnia pulex]
MYQIAKNKKKKLEKNTHGKRNNFLPALTSFSKRLPNNTQHGTHTEGATTHTHTQKGGENDTNSTPPVFLSLSPTLYYCLIHSHQKQTAVIITGDKIKCPGLPFHYFLAGPRPSYVTLFHLLGVLDLTLQLTRESQKRQKQTKAPKNI